MSKSIYHRRAMRDGSTRYSRDGIKITEAEFFRAVPAARAVTPRTLERGFTVNSGFRVTSTGFGTGRKSAQPLPEINFNDDDQVRLRMQQLKALAQ